MASGGACGSRSPSPAERLPPPFPEPHGGDSDAPGAADSDTEGEDIFTGTSRPTAPKRESLLPVSSTSKENGVHVEQDDQDLFADATVELSLDSTQNNQKKELAKASNPAPSLEVAASSSSRNPPKSYEELEEEEQEDKFELTVGVSDPEKVGDGMNAYVAYKVSTQTSMPMFRSKQFSVKRRFSDFLGLYEKLSEKHAQNGFIVPPPPEKSLIGMTKVKVGKEDSSSAEFLEKRRAALERYLRRVVSHPTMLQDPDVREFLEKEELPRAVGTQTLSGAGILKMFNKATDAVSKMTIKMNESDIWFEEKLQEVECEDQRLRKLHAVVETLVNHRKELALNTAQFAKSLAMLGSSEDNTALSRALSQLAEVEEKIEQLHQEQANNDFFLLAELLGDYIRLLSVVRGAFDQRMKTWQRWQDAQTMLQKKREMEARLLWANKPDKLQQAKEEISEWESRVTQYERDFERISAVIRKEVIRFEKEKSKDFRNHVTKYLEMLLNSQQQLVKYWEAFLPEAKAIS
ncbi:sorting nexin-1 isoform X2 [Falco biarmicus]|uniref:Sorting nexin-1 n=1 Tax=Falco tinnunculus TaxID=100819 RepID=A0A8C4V3H4_FALTI|nr:sorting nexin-1 isoform X2 [Falco rusticolus]XP_055573419.1 sorting nexin-1 isoform X2 [Falco cherrug]XP_055675078.1 sorting nexin-1 isoform X2 [Falco peregrinus]XP_056200831.1 sorting nexin-1 isoform X2 [Falco biarmicus]